LKKNLSRLGVADDVTLINRRSFDAETISEVRQTIGSGEVGLFIFGRRLLRTGEGSPHPGAG